MGESVKVVRDKGSNTLNQSPRFNHIQKCYARANSRTPAPKTSVFKYMHFITTSKIYLHHFYGSCNKQRMCSLCWSCCNSDTTSTIAVQQILQCYFSKHLKGEAFKIICILIQRFFLEFLFLMLFIFLFKSR